MLPSLWIGLAILLAAITGLVYWWFTPGRTPRLRGPNSVATLEKVRVGGADQALLVRGVDRSRPVVLFLHGGPGMPAMFLAHAFQRELESDFVVAHWDRRGAGKSFRPALGDSLSFDQLLSDTFEVSELLRRRFHQERILLVAHSWGTLLGMVAISRRPELYRAYIGVGQLGRTTEIKRIQDEFIRRRANESGEVAAIEELRLRGDRVREKLLFRFGGELHASKSFLPLFLAGLLAPEYSLRDVLNIPKGVSLYSRRFELPSDGRDLPEMVARVRVPVFFFTGRHDFTDPSSLTEEYLNRLDAPEKRLIWFENSAHFPFFEEPAAFAQHLREVLQTLSGAGMSPRRSP